MIVTLNDVLYEAQKNKYAVGLFNAVNFEMAKGILLAAEELNAPVIIGTAEVLLKSSSLEEVSYFLKPMAEKAKVPVVLHFDHGLTEERIYEAISLGFSSVMYDCSKDDLETNISKVSKVVKHAHKMGVTVEAELGHVGSNKNSAEGHGAGDVNVYTVPSEALRFVKETECDALAISIGTAHGAYKKLPKLELSLLDEIRKTLDIPLVLHGGSGLTDDDFRNAISHGISKVNIFTDVNCAAARGVYDNYKDGDGIVTLMGNSIESVKIAAMEKINLFKNL